MDGKEADRDIFRGRADMKIITKFRKPRRKPHSGARLGGVFHIKCFDKHGRLKWQDEAKNLVTNVGLQHILDILFVSATSQVDPWYVGLTDGTPTPAAGDTAASHGGWTEVTAYDEANRQTFTDARADQQVDNDGNEATFTISSDSTTIGGAFLISDNTKGGSSGTLLCVAAFSGGDKSADDDDTLEVEYQFTAADDGV